MKPAWSPIPPFNRTKRNRPLSKGNITVLIVLLVLTGVGFGWRASARQSSGDATRSGQEQLPTLHGDQAIEQLQRQGSYGSLQEAIGAIKYEAALQPSPKIAGLGAAYEFKNPSNNLLAYITGDGINVTSLGDMEKDWRLGLRLTGYGYGTNLSSVQEGEVTASQNRVSIQKSVIFNRQSAIEEWFINSNRGIEHGFTIASAPGERKASQPLRLSFVVSGDLQLTINGEGNGAAFHSASDDVLLSYNKLFATDAKGRALAATMKQEDRGLVIEVDDGVAEYPLTIDPILNQQQKLTASDGFVGDEFGFSVATSGDTVVVGARVDEVGGNFAQGSAYVFTRTGSTWVQQQKLTASDGALGDEFGSSVDIAGNTVVVGAAGDTVGANSNQGSVYVFTRSGTTWSQQQKLLAGDGAEHDFFGRAVAISGDTVVVGAIGGDVGDNIDQGTAYVFTRSSPTWLQQQKLIAADGATFDQFGFSVAISDDTVVVGAIVDVVGPIQGSAYVFTRSDTVWMQQQELTPIDGAAGDSGFGFSVAVASDTVVVGANGDTVGANSGQGSAYVFIRSSTTWMLQQKLTASDGAANDNLGSSVAISGNTVLVGASGDDIGANPSQGSAYVFIRSGPVWLQQQKLVASDGAGGDQFGASVAINGDTAVVGALLSNVGANYDQGSAYVFVCEYNQQTDILASDGAAADQFGNSVAISGDTVVVGAYVDDVVASVNQGSAYVFTRSGTTWTQQQKLTASDGAANDRFGSSVGISGDTVVVGAPLHKVGSNLDQGSAYVFTKTGATWTEQGQLTASDGAAGDRFGGSAAISSDTVVVGAALDTVGSNGAQGSAYVFTRNGTTWTEQQKLTANDGAANDYFGSSVAISGDTVVVGAYWDDFGANPDQGSAYVFTRSGTTWIQQQQLTASDGAAVDQFGSSVAISGDTVGVGAWSDDILANPDQGSAYVFTRSGTTWTQEQHLMASDGAANDNFGYRVAISGDTVVIGAVSDSVGANAFQGSAYVFTRSGTMWRQQQKLTASDGAGGDRFSVSVSISGDTLVVGADLDDVGANLDQGSAYIFFKGCNTSPVIVASGYVASQQGSPAASATIANVEDSQDPIGYLTVSVASAPTDISITNVTNTNGIITATISASCYAGPGNNIVILQVQDSDGAVSTVQLLVVVSANSLPTLGGYADTSVAVTGSTTVAASFAPFDNGSIVQFSATSPTFAGTLGASRSSGSITIANARPAGVHVVTVTAIDNCGDTISSGFFLMVTCQAITVNPATIPGGTAGTPYSQPFDQTGGIGTVTFTLTGTLPAGLSFNTDSAKVFGTPTQVGNFPITVIATDVNGCSGSRNYTLTINAAMLVWTGNTSSDWHTATNWTPIAVPTSFHDVLVPSAGVVNEPVVSSSSSVIHAMTVQAGRILTINSSRQLITQGDIASSGQITGAGLLAFEGATFTQDGAVSVASVQFDPGSHSLTGGGAFASGIVTVLNGASVSLTSDHSISVLVINGGGSFDATSRTLMLTGAGTAIFNSGTFTTTGSTIVYAGSVSQVVTANVAYNNLTIDNSAGASLAGDTSVIGMLSLRTDLTTGVFTLTMPAGGTSIGAGDVVGNVKRTGFATGGVALSFGNPLNTIRFDSGVAPTDVTVNLVKSSPPSFSSTVARTYAITPNGGSGFTATLRLRYKDSEAVGLTESTFELWRYGGASWVSPAGSAMRDTTANWVEENSISTFSPWTIAGPSGPTEVKLISFDATGHDNGVLLEWKTGFEVDNLGFRIYRQEGGTRSLLNSELIAGSALTAGSGTVLTAGRTYSFWADARDAGKDSTYWLEDIDLNGQSTWHGPVFVKHLGGKPPSRSFAESLSQVGRPANAYATRPVANFAELARPTWSGSSAVSLQQESLASGHAVKIGVQQANWYRVAQAELIKSGLDPKADPRTLRLFVDGIELPIFVAGETDGSLDASDAVEFYGLGLNTPSTDTRIYWLVAGSQPGLRINRVAFAQGHRTGESFPFSVERRDRTIYFSALKNGDEENFFGAVITGGPIDQRITLNNLAYSAGDSAVIEVSLQGVTNLAHQVNVSLNGSSIGRLLFSGQAKGQQSIELAQALLREGDNVITLQSINGPSDISLVDSIRITYQHSFRAENDELSFAVKSGQTAIVSGFSSKGIRVFDVTDERNVQELDVLVDQAKDGYAATLTAPEASVDGIRTERKLLALTDGKASQPANIKANSPSHLRDASNAADFIIVSHATLIESLEPLAALRGKQGLATVLVDIGDIYDEFSFGDKSPQSIRDFLSLAATRWKHKPRFVLLAGDASYDSRNYLGLGDNDLAPTKLIDTGYLETASDDWFGDFDDDGIADLSIGRLPVGSAAEASVVVNKLIAYELSAPLNEVALVADSNEGFDFEKAATSLKSLIPSSIRVSEIFRSRTDDTTARSQVLDAINHGQKIVNYAGHGSADVWRGNLLTALDGQYLTNRDRLSVFVMMTCLNGYFQDAMNQSLGESLLKAENGAVAVWASSGLTLPQDQAEMNRELYRLLFSAGNREMTLGELMRQAKGAISDGDIRRSWILLGDPTVRVK
jgi:hypothetical protein